MKTEDVTKLPKWAQDKIGYLERDIRDLRRERENNWSGDRKTDVFIRQFGHGTATEENIPLPHGATIVFEMDDEVGDRRIDVQVGERSGRKVIEIYASGRNRQHLIIEPMSSNYILVDNYDPDRV